MNKLNWILPSLIAALAAVWILSVAARTPENPGLFDMNSFGQLPVVYQGRVKPYDTLARNALMVISRRQTWTDAEGKRQPAIRWLLDVISNSDRAVDHRIFRIDHPQVLAMLGLDAEKGPRFAIRDFGAKIGEIDQAANKARELPTAQRDAFDSKVLELAEQLHLYLRLRESHRFPIIKDGQQAMAAARQWSEISRAPVPHPLPPRSAEESWTPLTQAALEAIVAGNPHPSLEPLTLALHYWANDQAPEFNQELEKYGHTLTQLAPADWHADKTGFETFFNRVEPFYLCSVLYVIAFLLSGLGLLSGWKPLDRSAFWLIVLVLLVHTFALASRIYISGRPPVTNLYSSAVFIGWGAVILGLVMEAIYRLGIGSFVGAAAGSVTLVIAHFLSLDGDTFEMLQAVLDTQFWLATHVVTITIGYAGTYVAGLLGAVFILLGVFTRLLDASRIKMLRSMIYGVVCFSLFFSFVGTVLGGLWADDSWGRFWGWDPKENGALIIVLWNAIILHARWAGLVRERGLAALAVFGNVVTSWSWFGVNMLGVGLHSYGFMESAAFWLLVFIFSQLALMAVGMLPGRFWKSADSAPAANALPPDTAAAKA